MSLDINLTNVQSKAVVVSDNQTAVNDAWYINVANATYTDPSPIEGRGFTVDVLNATATINSIAYSVVGTRIVRRFHSGSWITIVSLPDSNFINKSDIAEDTIVGRRGSDPVQSLTPADAQAVLRFVSKDDYTTARSVMVQQSGTANPSIVAIGVNEVLGRVSGGGGALKGLTVAEQKTMLNYTASDVGAVANSSDAILSALGWWQIHDTTAGSNSSGTSNTISKSIQIGVITDVLNIEKVTFIKTGTNAVFSGRIYLSEVDNNIGGTAILLATYTSGNANNIYLATERLFEKIGSNIVGINASSSNSTDRIVSSQARLNTAILTASPLYLIFTVQCTSGSDVARFESAYIKNF